MHFQTKFLLLSNLFYLNFSITGSTKMKPNRVFMLTDDYGWNDVGFHGSTQVKTQLLPTFPLPAYLKKNVFFLNIFLFGR